MSDPLSLIALGAAVGGAAGKFVEKAWDSGERWLTTYFANHRETAQDQARENAASFLREVGREIDVRTSVGDVSEQEIASAQDHPDFSATLQSAVISAAQTESDDKHKLLARVIAERLAAKPDTTLAVASKMAADAIALATSNQLRLLGLQVNILLIRPVTDLSADGFKVFLQARLTPYVHLQLQRIDLLHLEAISCGRFEPFMGRNLGQILRNKSPEHFDQEWLDRVGILTPLTKLWDDGLQHFSLTSVGQIIGIYVSDLICGGKTSLSNWVT